MEKHEPTPEEIDHANAFCHAFFRFIISEGIEPHNAIMYISAAAAQVVRNITNGGQYDETTVMIMFTHNMLYFLELMSPAGGTPYPIPTRN